MVLPPYAKADAEAEIRDYFNKLRLSIINFDCVDKEVYAKVVSIIEKITPVIL